MNALKVLNITRSIRKTSFNRGKKLKIPRPVEIITDPSRYHFPMPSLIGYSRDPDLSLPTTSWRSEEDSSIAFKVTTSI
jgi:hypothetical protein